MRLGPESRRQVGDNYESIIFQLLRDFGWTSVRTNSEIDVPTSVRPSGRQGIDGNFLYFDPFYRYDIGVHVESKKVKDIAAFRSELPKWLVDINSALLFTSASLYSLPFKGVSHSGSVQIQESLLSVWIDEPFDPEAIRGIVDQATQALHSDKKKALEEFASVAVVTNNRLQQLQAVVTQLWAFMGRHSISGYFSFEYPRLGQFDAPNMMMLLGDNLFIRANSDANAGQYRLVAFYLGTTSTQRVNFFTSSLIDALGPHIRNSQGLSVYVWDMPPSDPEKVGLWHTLFRDNVAPKYGSTEGFVTVTGFNPNYLRL